MLYNDVKNISFIVRFRFKIFISFTSNSEYFCVSIIDISFIFCLAVLSTIMAIILNILRPFITVTVRVS